MQKEFTEFFFNGNQTHCELVSELKRNFMRLVTGMYVPPIYCKIPPAGWHPENLRVYVRKAVLTINE